MTVMHSTLRRENDPLIDSTKMKVHQYTGEQRITSPTSANSLDGELSRQDSFERPYPGRIEVDGFKTVESFMSIEENDGENEALLGKRKVKELWPRIDQGAIQFGLRMGVLLTISSLFVLVRTENWYYPDGMWVLVSVLFVCWFPTLDAASVIEKIMQRLIGTFLGAFLGLGCGFISIWIFHDQLYQSIFLAICMFVFNFAIVFLAGQCNVGGQKVIKRFAYATILCTLTFCICMLPFALDADPKWEKGVMRVVNVIIGCFLGAFGSVTICPKSTNEVLYEKTARQVRLAGEACEALMQTASDFFGGKVEVHRLADELLNAGFESSLRWKMRRTNSGMSDDSCLAKADIALKKYEDAIMDWRATKALFPLAKFDPFYLPIAQQPEKAKKIQTEIARTLARALRIQTTIIVLDGMVRNDADYEFNDTHLFLFFQVGSRIKEMLTVPIDLRRSNNAARELFHKLEEVRGYITHMSSQVSTTNQQRNQGVSDFKRAILVDVRDDVCASKFDAETEDDEGRGIPKNATGSHDNTLFFLQLVEHLILRSLRLYQAWKHVEVKFAH